MVFNREWAIANDSYLSNNVEILLRDLLGRGLSHNYLRN